MNLCLFSGGLISLRLWLPSRSVRSLLLRELNEDANSSLASSIFTVYLYEYRAGFPVILSKKWL